MKSAPDGSASACLICGSSDSLTVEHIVPQTLWNRFGLGPNHERLTRYCTTLCSFHNSATSRLHQRTEVIDLIEKGQPATKKSLRLLADWAVWVTLLLGLSTGEGVLTEDEARRLLSDRFDGRDGGLPRGIRVYIARVADYISGSSFTSHMVGVVDDGRIVLDSAGTPIGFSERTGPITASEAIGLGKIAILVLSRTYSSGRDQNARLDAAAATVGMDRIHPPAVAVPVLVPRVTDMTAVSRVFLPVPHGSDSSLLPDAVKQVVALLTPRGS